MRRASSSQAIAAGATSRPSATISASSSAARVSSSLIESASPSMARPASALATFGGKSRLTAIPTAAPTSVSAIRCPAAGCAAREPTPSTSIPLIATSMRFERSRSTWPIVMDTKMSTPRLHHSNGTISAKTTASETPMTTATTRSKPLASSETGVTCTTSIPVSGASRGRALGKSSVATT